MLFSFLYAGRDRKHSQQSSSDESDESSEDDSDADDSEYRAARFDMPRFCGGIGCAATGAGVSSCSQTELPFAS